MKRLLKLSSFFLLGLWLVLPLFRPAPFQSSDNQARDSIAESRPGYKPWANPFWQPESAEVESGLFALQAGLAGLVLGYVLGRLERRART